MAHETKLVSGKITHHGHVRVKDDIAVAYDENEEIEMAEPNNFYDRMTQVMEKFASTRMGQMMLEKSDRVLKVVEDTAKWSLPQDDSDIILERPLPWLMFLSLIVWMRIFRICLSAGLYIVGSQPVTAHSIVYYVQIKRRRLRAMRVKGLKLIKNREIETTVMQSSNKNVTSIGKLRTLINTAICKPGQYRESSARCVLTPDSKSVQNLSEHSSKRHRYDDDDDEDDDGAAVHNLTVSEMLDKYANEDSDNDSDYIPEEDEDEEEDEDDDNDSSTLYTTRSSSEELENGEAEAPSEYNETQMKPSKSEINTISEQPHREKIQENGQPISAPFKEVQTKNVPATSDRNDYEQIHKTRDTNGVAEPAETNESPAATPEVASKSALNTPKTIVNYMVAPQVQENEKKSTPGHESAASLKPSLSTATRAVPLIPPQKEKSYRTITTQTAIELDWTITIKTEITHKKHYPKLEKLNYSVNLTPASSAEDIFYSPMGSHQDFHTIFHPVSIVKSTNAEGQTSTPKGSAQYKSSSTETLDTLAAGSQKKYYNHAAHNKHYHHNSKNHSKNRR